MLSRIWITLVGLLSVPLSTLCADGPMLRAAMCNPHSSLDLRCVTEGTYPAIRKGFYGRIWPLYDALAAGGEEASTNEEGERCWWQQRDTQPDLTMDLPLTSLECYARVADQASCVLYADWSVMERFPDDSRYKGNSYFEVHYFCKQKVDSPTTTSATPNDYTVKSLITAATTTTLNNQTETNQTRVDEQNYFSKDSTENYAIGFSVLLFAVLVTGICAFCATMLRKSYKKRSKKMDNLGRDNSVSTMGSFSTATYKAGRLIDSLYIRTQTIFRRNSSQSNTQVVDPPYYGIYMDPDAVTGGKPPPYTSAASVTTNNEARAPSRYVTANNDVRALPALDVKDRPPAINPVFQGGGGGGVSDVPQSGYLGCVYGSNANCNASYQSLHPNASHMCLCDSRGMLNPIAEKKTNVSPPSKEKKKNGDYEYAMTKGIRVDDSDLDMATVLNASSRKRPPDGGEYEMLHEESKVTFDHLQKAPAPVLKAKVKTPPAATAETNDLNTPQDDVSVPNQFYNVCQEDSEESDCHPDYDNVTLIVQQFKDDHKDKDRESFDNPGYIGKSDIIFPNTVQDKEFYDKIQQLTNSDQNATKLQTAPDVQEVPNLKAENDANEKGNKEKKVKYKPTYAVVNKANKAATPQPKIAPQENNVSKQINNEPINLEISDNVEKPRLPTKKARRGKDDNIKGERIDQNKPRLPTKKNAIDRKTNNPEKCECQKPRLPTKIRRDNKGLRDNCAEGGLQTKPRLPTKVKRPKNVRTGETQESSVQEKPRLPTKVKRPKQTDASQSNEKGLPSTQIKGQVGRSVQDKVKAYEKQGSREKDDEVAPGKGVKPRLPTKVKRPIKVSDISPATGSRMSHGVAVEDKDAKQSSSGYDHELMNSVKNSDQESDASTFSMEENDAYDNITKCRTLPSPVAAAVSASAATPAVKIIQPENDPCSTTQHACVQDPLHRTVSGESSVSLASYVSMNHPLQCTHTTCTDVDDLCSDEQYYENMMKDDQNGYGYDDDGSIYDNALTMYDYTSESGDDDEDIYDNVICEGCGNYISDGDENYENKDDCDDYDDGTSTIKL